MMHQRVLKAVQPRFYLYPLFSGKGIIIRVIIILSLVLGFLFYIYFAPYLNKYYILDPIQESTAQYFINVDIKPAPYSEAEAYEKASAIIVDCLGSGPYVVTALTTIDVNGKEYAVAVALDNRSIRFIAPDIPSNMFASHARSFDGVLIRQDTMAKTSEPVPRTTMLRINGYALHLLGTHSRIVLSYARNLVLLYNTVKARNILKKLYISDILSSSNSALEHAELCIRKADKTLSSIGLGRVSFTLETKEALYERNREAAFGSEFYEWMALASGLSLAVSLVVSAREGLGLAAASSELIGLLRLYGASVYTVLVMGLVTGVVIAVSVVAGLLVVSRLVFDLLLPVRLPPLLYILYSSRELLLGVFLSIVLATALGFVVFTRRSSLEDLVSSR